MTRRFCVIGDPVAQSLSPRIHTHWINRYALDACYDAVQVAAGELEHGIADLLDRGYRGWNVTIPHKVRMLERCDHIDDIARKIGAVNTVAVGDDGALTGTNTDAYGFIAHLDQAQPGWRHGPGRRALVLGAGGAARAVIFGLIGAGVGAITIANRTRDKADQWAAGIADVSVIDWADRNDAVAAVDLIVNTTALGMTGLPDLDFSLDGAAPGTIVYDIVYRPLETPLIQAARARGLPVITGLGMLLHQARPAFKAWFDILPPVDHELMDAIAGEL